MGYFIQPILTDKASSETALAIQNREPLVFTRIALGSGRHRTDAGKKNDVAQVVHSLQVAQSISTETADTIRIVARLDNSRIEREMIVNEIGVFAKRGNHEEFMYMYTWAEQGDVIPPKTSAYVYRDYDFNTTISKNSQITIQYNANNLVYASISELKSTETKLQNNIDNHSRDTSRHVSVEERTKWNGKADATHRHKVADIDGLEAIIGNQTTNKANQADLTGHINNRNNPHSVTKEQVGLGNVTNVEQASKQDLQNHLNNHNNPHGVTKTQVGLGNVTNVEQASKQEFNAHTTNRKNPHNVTKEQVGLANVTNVEQASKTDFDAHARDTTKHITQQERTAWNGKADGRALTDHTGNRNNPHGVTKAQVGLGNVVNVEQASKSEFNSHSQNSTIHVSSVDKNRWNNAQLTKLTNDNGSAKAATGNWDSYVESGMYTGAGLTNSPKSSRSPLYVTVTKIDGQNVMQQAVDNANTFTAVRTKVNGVWGSWQVLPRLDMKVIPLEFESGVRPSRFALEGDNKIYVIGNVVILKFAITGESLKNAPNNGSVYDKKLFRIPTDLLPAKRGGETDSLPALYGKSDMIVSQYKNNSPAGSFFSLEISFDHKDGLCHTYPPTPAYQNYCNIFMWIKK